jgi:hypothetical protein
MQAAPRAAAIQTEQLCQNARCSLARRRNNDSEILRTSRGVSPISRACTPDGISLHFNKSYSLFLPNTAVSAEHR